MKRKRKEWLEASGNRALRRRLDGPQSSKTSSNNGSGLTLPKVKMTQFQVDSTTASSHLTSFMAPIRNSQNPVQTSVLARFKKERDLPAEVTHSQSFPFAGGRLPRSAVLSSSSLSQLALHEAGNSGENSSSRGGIQNLGGGVRPDHGDPSIGESTSGEQQNLCKAEVTSKEPDKTSESPSNQSDLLVSSSGSFTVHRKHTFSSAAAAGLPVVEGNYSHHASDRRTVFQDQEEGEKEDNGEAGTSDGRKNTILLTHFLQLHHGHGRESSVDWESTPDVELVVPPSVENLKKKLAPILDSFNSEESDLRAKVTVELHRVFPNFSGGEEEPLEISKSSKFISVTNSDSAHAEIENSTEDSQSTVATTMSTKSKSRNKLGLGYQKVTASLEQFERNEQLVLQHTAGNQAPAPNSVVKKTQTYTGDDTGALANGGCSGTFSSSDTSSGDISRKPDIQAGEGAVSNTVISYRMKGQANSIGGDIRSAGAEIEFGTTAVKTSGNVPIPIEEISESDLVYSSKQKVEANTTKESYGTSKGRAGLDSGREPSRTEALNSNAYGNGQILNGQNEVSTSNRPVSDWASGEQLRLTDQFPQRRAPTSAEGSDEGNGATVKEVEGESESRCSSNMGEACRGNLRFASFFSVSNDVAAKPSNPWVSPLHQDLTVSLFRAAQWMMCFINVVILN